MSQSEVSSSTTLWKVSMSFLPYVLVLAVHLDHSKICLLLVLFYLNNPIFQLLSTLCCFRFGMIIMVWCLWLNSDLLWPCGVKIGQNNLTTKVKQAKMDASMLKNTLFLGEKWVKITICFQSLEVLTILPSISMGTGSIIH